MKKIPEFEDYSITDCGKVFKNDIQISSVGSCSGKYRKVCLHKNGKKFYKDVHRLVAMTYIGDVSGKVVNHLDFDGHNNNVKNLEIVTQKQNVAHTIKNKRHCYGNKHHRLKISDKKLLICYLLKNFGFTYKQIEKEYNLTEKTLCVAITNRILKFAR